MKVREGYFEERKLPAVPEAGLSEISGIPVLDQKKVLDITQMVYPSVQKWAAQFPVMLPVRAASTTLACSAMCPDQPHEVIANATKFCLLLFALDDVVDSAIDELSDDEIEVILSLFKLQVNSREVIAPLDNYNSVNVKPWIQVILALHKITQELLSYPAAKWYYPIFAHRFCCVMETMREEIHWRQMREANGFLPDYAAYMENGKESIASPTVLSFLLAMVGPEPDRPVSEMEGQLEELVLTAGYTARLSNDIAGFAREKLENKPNSLMILMEGGLTEKESEKFVINDVNNYLSRLNGLVQLLPERYRIWGRYCERLSWFAKDWYRVREFHQFKPEELQGLSQKAESKSQ